MKNRLLLSVVSFLSSISHWWERQTTKDKSQQRWEEKKKTNKKTKVTYTQKLNNSDKILLKNFFYDETYIREVVGETTGYSKISPTHKLSRLFNFNMSSCLCVCFYCCWLSIRTKQNKHQKRNSLKRENKHFGFVSFFIFMSSVKVNEQNVPVTNTLSFIALCTMCTCEINIFMRTEDNMKRGTQKRQTERTNNKSKHKTKKKKHKPTWRNFSCVQLCLLLLVSAKNIFNA